MLKKAGVKSGLSTMAMSPGCVLLLVQRVLEVPHVAILEEGRTSEGTEVRD